MTIRSALARRHGRYLLTHPLGVVSVIFPPVRVLFSLRLVRSVFGAGNLHRFLLAASVLVINGAIIVYLYERHAPKSNIHTLGDSLWWSAVTVTTVGYGDFFRSPQGGGSWLASSWVPVCSPWPLSPRRWRRASSPKGAARRWNRHTGGDAG
jgi:Ion channel